MIALILVIVVTIACVYITHDTIPPEAVIPQVPDSRLNGNYGFTFVCIQKDNHLFTFFIVMMCYCLN